MSPCPGTTGRLCTKLGQYYEGVNQAIHRLVLETFVGECPEGNEALHNNGNYLDNRLSNLRWGTRSENSKDKTLHERNRFTYEEADKIREIYANQVIKNMSEIARMYGVNPGTIWYIVNGKHYVR
jgi:hypothetical protein